MASTNSLTLSECAAVPDRKESPRESLLADLAQLVNEISREIILLTETNNDLLELTASEVNVLRYIEDNPGTLPRDAALDVGLQRSNISVVLHRLSAKGMIATVPDQDDGRKIHLFPTEEAKRNLILHRIRWAGILADASCDDQSLTGCLQVLNQVGETLTAIRRKRAQERKSE